MPSHSYNLDNISDQEAKEIADAMIGILHAVVSGIVVGSCPTCHGSGKVAHLMTVTP